MQHYQAQAKLREAMTSDGKLQHGQEEAKQKSLETPRQTTLQRVENAASHQKGREAQWEHHLLPYYGESEDPTFQPYALGSMNFKCICCGALRLSKLEETGTDRPIAVVCRVSGIYLVCRVSEARFTPRTFAIKFLRQNLQLILWIPKTWINLSEQNCTMIVPSCMRKW